MFIGKLRFSNLSVSGVARMFVTWGYTKILRSVCMKVDDFKFIFGVLNS